jgi:LPXTG-motif cell wall-anchored protein
MRRIAAGLIGVLVAGSALVGLMPVWAGAQTTTDGVQCTYEVDPTVLPPGGGNVTVSGTAPGSSTVWIYADGHLVATSATNPGTGAFSVTIFLAATAEISVSVNNYPPSPCVGVGSNVVHRDPNGVTVRGLTATLPQTGSSDTGWMTVVGAVAVMGGLLLVVAARRRRVEQS